MQLSDYMALIPGPNNLAPKFTSWMEANLQPYVDAQACLDSFDSAFHIDTAVGVQLDILGQILSLSKTVNFKPDGGQSPILDDDLYRIALKAKIFKNQWNGSKSQIYDFWQQHFPQYPVLIQDNQDMTMTVVVIGMPNDISNTVTFGYNMETSTVKGYNEGYWGPFTSLLRQMVMNGYFTPKPSTVSVNYSFSDTAVFGYNVESQYLKGYNEGSWVSI